MKQLHCLSPRYIGMEVFWPLLSTFSFGNEMKSFSLILKRIIRLFLCISCIALAAPSLVSANDINSHALQAIRFENGFAAQGDFSSAWGAENAEFIEEAGISGKVMRIRYPLGSLDPATMRKEGRRYGGMGFKRKVFSTPEQCATLSYQVRFAPDFDFVRGGKMPGLYGGAGNSGGKIPNGRDGFSTRYMWLSGGRGQVYAYLPTSIQYGTTIGAGQFKFVRGIWNTLKQQVELNQPGRSDGRIRVWLNGIKVVDQGDIRFRDIQQLGIDGIFFDTFFGGSDDSWRSRQDTYADFADFSVERCSD
jgi:hypothetical protein